MHRTVNGFVNCKFLRLNLYASINNLQTIQFLPAGVAKGRSVIPFFTGQGGGRGGTSSQIDHDSLGFLWVFPGIFGFLGVPFRSYEFLCVPLDSSGFLGIPWGSFRFNWVPGKVSLLFLGGIPWGSLGFLKVP